MRTFVGMDTADLLRMTKYIEVERKRRKISKREMAATMKMSVDTYKRRLVEGDGFTEREMAVVLKDWDQRLTSIVVID
jgi:hypothetical protein